MTLAEVRIDPRNPSARRALADCHDMHRNIMRAFHDVDDDHPRLTLGVQYRLLQTDEEIKALVLSDQPGEWDRAEADGYALLREKSVDGLLESFAAGRVMGFDLFCVPSKKIKGDGKNSKRCALTDSRERAEWLRRKGRDAGFDVVSYAESGSFSAAGARAGQHIRFEYVRMVGNLRIVDEKKFENAYRTGIGPEKAYGMGMLLLGRRLL